MDLILSEFQRDLETVGRQLDLLDRARMFSSTPEIPERYRAALSPDAISKADATSELRKYLAQANELHLHARAAHAGLPVVAGTIVLYIAGRFEEFTRTSFEDLCQKLAQRAADFKALPKRMQENLVLFTAIVIQSPRKYQHGDGAVAGFTKNLAENLSTHSVDNINYQCLSITDANMRPEMLAELYERIGVKELWKKVAQQANIQAHFETPDLSNAEALARKSLNSLMDLRNTIAHPSTTIVWPDTDTVRKHVRFLNVLAVALSDLSSVFAVTLCNSGQQS